MKQSFSLSFGLLVGLFSPRTLCAQTMETVQELYVDHLSDPEEQGQIEDQLDILQEYAEHPIDINAATREDLERLGILAAQEVEDIVAYLYQYGPMKSLGELAMIPSLSWYQRQMLERVVYVGSAKPKSFPSFRSIAKYGKQELVAMAKVPFYDRQGDEEGYLGNKYKHWLRYQFRYGDYVKCGFLGSQDAGEPFFSGKNKWGYDFYTFYFQLRKWGRMKNLTVGRYRLHFGQGLILNNDFGFGKQSFLANMGSQNNVIRVHSSRSASNFLQGAAATVTLAKGLDASAFVSYRKIDATIKEGGISTIVTTGLHRTQKEVEKQAVASASLVGGNLNFRSHGFHAGTTAFLASYSLPLSPNKQQLYKRYAPEGNRFWNASVDYGYLSHRWSIAGETATGDCGVVATVNSIGYLFSERFSLAAVQRFYPIRYYSLYSNAFSEGSDVQDESGVYLGAKWLPFSKLELTGYVDLAYFAWPKYQTTGSTQSQDYSLALTYRPSESWTVGARYRYKQKLSTTQRARLYLTHVSPHWNLRTYVDASYSEKETRSKGWMASQTVGYHQGWLRLSAHLGYFHTSDYASRIYSYEPGLLYNMNFSSYYGEGIRYSLLLRSEIGRHVIAFCKMGVTDYFDRDHISSGLQQINRSSQADMELQVKWKF